MRLIIGIDEVGRGAIAGPVVAGAVAIEKIIPGVRDSKALNIKQRETLAQEIENHAIAVAIEIIHPKTIDKLNIHNATLLAMKNAFLSAIEQIDTKLDEVFIFIDGLHIFKINPDELNKQINLNLIAIPRADKFIYQVSCASIYAKHTRDTMMMTIEHARFPDYNFKRNLGYPTPEHIRILKQIGPCEIHRKSFLKNLNSAKASPQTKGSLGPLGQENLFKLAENIGKSDPPNKGVLRTFGK